jgi:hypothetical protein
MPANPNRMSDGTKAFHVIRYQLNQTDLKSEIVGFTGQNSGAGLLRE